MALPLSGKTYRFENLGASGRYLNLYSTGTASNGMNVVPWTGDTSNEQKWKFDGTRLRPLTNTNFSLDRYDVDGQCTWHCAGRSKEVKGKTIQFSQVSGRHGKFWWNYVNNCTKTSVATSNSIAVWDDGGLYGHVGYVENVVGTTVYLTEANWATANDAVDAEDGKVIKLTTESMKKRGASGEYALLGYLVL